MVLRKVTLSAIAALLLGAMAAIAEPVSIELEAGSFRVQGWAPPRNQPPKGWASVFAVYAASGDVPPLAGTYEIDHGTLVFHPRFPFASGVEYRAVFRAPGGGAAIERIFSGPPPDTKPAARVEQIYPTTDVLPSNQLRLYIYFSAPMSRGEAGAHVRMLDDKGQVLPGVFLPGEELWDPGFRRLTLTFDPGRIKRGLTSNEAMGPPIVEGKHYTLVIDRGWPDARGVPMLAEFRKSFRGGPSQRHSPDPAQWKVIAPNAGSPDPVAVIFPVPMNYPLLRRMIQVANAGRTIAGTVNIGRQETEWRLTPQQPWKPGAYQLIVDTGLEDLAGNSVSQPFDIDVFQRVTRHIATKTVTLPFSVR
jgi:hypothetical protein